METKTIYLIKYNDCYGNGDESYIECAITEKKYFKDWLNEHNKDREFDGNEPEGEEEFDLIEYKIFK